jgi:ubiquitin carboxyl-terminal hydrolase 16
MPDKPFTVLTYAASASLAAIALIYFFSPNHLLDADSSTHSTNTRRKGVVGLSNPANDCFINSILQALAGLGELRLYLIRELHRRELDGPDIYLALPEQDPNEKRINCRNLASLQKGEVTKGLKEILDKLNERPLYRKTISAGEFIEVLEHAFETRISKSQQDAQELLQIVAERLAEEYSAGREARKRARKANSPRRADTIAMPIPISEEADREITQHPPPEAPVSHEAGPVEEPGLEAEDGFPLEGQTEAQIECQFCHFQPKSYPTSFVMLNLMVPHKNVTTLNECFDAHFKIEYIDDYKCDKCRLQHALQIYSQKLASAKSDEERHSFQAAVDRLTAALDEDPEKAPNGVVLPDIKSVPKRKVSRHVEITKFPRILVIHLSRSIYDPWNSSTKNAAKVSFPEQVPLGGLLNRRNYKLLGMVSHKGTHNSGHYESFRRQHVYAPYSTPHVQNEKSPYSASGTPTSSTVPSPKVLANPPPLDDNGSLSMSSPGGDGILSTPTLSPRASITSISNFSPSTRPSSGSLAGDPVANTPLRPNPPDTNGSATPALRSSSDKPSKPHRSSHHRPSSSLDMSRFRRRKKLDDHWWRISDDKIKECKTSDVLALQKDVYLLFYEMERDDEIT